AAACTRSRTISRSCSWTKQGLRLNSSVTGCPSRRPEIDPGSLLPDLPLGSRILLIRLRSLGDIVLLTPSLRLLKEWRQDLRISVLIESRFHDLLTGNTHVDEVLSPGGGGGIRQAKARLRMVRELRGRRFSLCVNLHGGPGSVFFSRYCGARWNAAFAHFRRQSSYDFAIPDARTILGQAVVHTAEHQASAFFWLGLPRQPVPASEIFVSDTGRDEWRSRLSSLDVAPARPYAILQPSALYPTKEWPAERFAQLGQYIEREAGLIPLFSCGPGESSHLDRVERASPRPIRRLEGLKLATFIAAVAGSALFVGNDSGPAHIAAACGVPLAVIFGSSNSRIWGPWMQPARSSGGEAAAPFRIVQNVYECNPCRGDRCYRFERPECVLSVTFEQVRSAVEAVLKGVSPESMAANKR
ncbi:MAG: glycosyltransferase family 9 protein, partial [Terriglobia bacterium]